MRQIQLVGPIDKRVIAYPLFKICDNLGKVLVITDDTNFRRFSDDYSNEFTVGRSDFYVMNLVNKESVESLGLRLSSYDYVLIITTNQIIEGNDNLVYCHGQNELICSEDVLDELEVNEHIDMLISTKKPKDKEIKFCGIDSKKLGYVWDCEENKLFMPCKVPELVNICSFLFAQTLGVSKEEFSQIIARELQ